MTQILTFSPRVLAKESSHGRSWTRGGSRRHKVAVGVGVGQGVGVGVGDEVGIRVGDEVGTGEGVGVGDGVGV